MPAMTQPAGWYPDNTQPNTERWFDGNAWTDASRPVGSNAPMASAPKKRKKWPWIVGAIVALIVIGTIVSAGNKKQGPAASVVASNSSGQSAPATHAAASSAAPQSSISHDLGSKDASKDVTIGAIAVDPVLGWPSVPVTVTNHSSKRSNYIIELSLESADGSTQIDTTAVTVQNLDAGQTSQQKGQFTTTNPLPAGAKVVVKSIDRLAA